MAKPMRRAASSPPSRPTDSGPGDPWTISATASPSRSVAARSWTSFIGFERRAAFHEEAYAVLAPARAGETEPGSEAFRGYPGAVCTGSSSAAGSREAGEGLQEGSRAAAWPRTLFGIDLRSLALFRVALASAILFDLGDRSRDLVAHYTDQGALPSGTATALFGTSTAASAHTWLSGSVTAEIALFVLAAVAGLCLLVGCYTRVAAVASWLLLVSLQARNPYAASMGGDILLRILLFWGLFLPLGARGSFDAWRRGEPLGPGRVFSAASAALLVQVALVYVVTGLHKSGQLWREGSAVQYALQLDYWATATGEWLRRFPALLVASTHATRTLEVLGPFLAFSPWRTAELRVATIALFAAFHVSLAAALDIGPFPVFCLVAWTAFLPSRFWDSWLPALLARLRRAPMAGAAPPAPRGFLLGAPRWANVLAATLLAYVVLFLALDVTHNVYGMRMELPRSITVIGGALRLNQHWRMFAPDPVRADVWLALVGRLADARVVDPLRGAPPLLEKPARLSASFPSFRWRLYLHYLSKGTARSTLALESLASYLCRSWNERHPGNPLVEIRLVLVMEPSPPSDSTLLREAVHTLRCTEARVRKDPPGERSLGAGAAAAHARAPPGDPRPSPVRFFR